MIKKSFKLLSLKNPGTNRNLSLLGKVLLLTFILQSCQSRERVDFSSQIKPILNKRCISCHGGVKKSGGFSLLFEDEALANTGEGRPAIIPGDAGASEFIKRLHEEDPELRMPYEQDKLPQEEIELLTRWIEEGAEWGEHWAYSLPESVELPEVKAMAGFGMEGQDDFLQNGIDHFILARLEDKELQHNQPADKYTIARRAALDLTGLPPDEGLLNAFLEDELSYEDLVDTLLARPSYGEKWASWWLDMARYADSKGYEKDSERTIWKYRDWVIKALNDDMPYDQFTLEQLAGDLLPQPSADQLIATAFHRNTMNNDEGGTDDEEFRVAAVLDRVNTTFSVWQSTTMECVQCHSHPYDPFRHEEYYKALAFFNNTRDEDTPDESPVIKSFSPDQEAKVEAVLEWVDRYGGEKVAEAYLDFMRFTEPVYKAHTLTDFKNGSFDDHYSSVLWDQGSCLLKKAYTYDATSIYLKYSCHYDGSVLRIREKDENGKQLASIQLNRTGGVTVGRFPIAKIQGSTDLHFSLESPGASKNANAINLFWIGFIPDLPGHDKDGYAKIAEDFLAIVNLKTLSTPILKENPPQMNRVTRVFERGNWMDQGKVVQPGVPMALNSWKEEWPKNRLGLAKWIVSDQNPLTARTLVNRVWHQIFGRGLVATLEDMGSQSDPPSHPALLDWLALRFMNEHQWQIKSLVKEIVLSGTYRQRSESDPETLQKDPENMFYAHGPRLRLSAEQIRDQALSVSGLLSSEMYGPSVMPPQPEGVWQTVYNNAKWEESEGENKYRRAIYTYLKRTSPYPSFITFDAGSREVSTVRRTVTNTPLQALVTLNDPVYLEASYALAKRTMVSGNIDHSISKAYQAALCRPVEPETISVLKALYQTSLSQFTREKERVKDFMVFEDEPNAELAAFTVVANTILNLDEFLTKS